jgi:N-acetylglucosamine kinase-like BadF-type ATPase
MPELYVGVDGGGTRTRAIVTGSDLLALGRGASGPANASTVPVPRLVQSVTEAIDDALEAAGASRSDIAVVSCGLAGVEASAMKGRLVAAFEAVFGAGRVRITTDARIALAGALPDPAADSGAVLIAGTGAICFGRNAHGLEERAGGWGALIGDEGSASEIARRGLAAVARDVDGRGPRTKMREALHASEGTRSAVEMVQKLFRPGAGPTDTAAYFPIVLDAAKDGDEVALEILRWAGGELALTAVTVLRKLGIADDRVTVATVGGVFVAGELVLAPLRSHLLAGAPRASLGPPAYIPEIGAIRLALSGADR